MTLTLKAGSRGQRPGTYALALLSVSGLALAIGCSTNEPESDSNLATTSSPPATEFAGGIGEELAPATVPEGMGSGAPDGEFPRTMEHFGGSTEIPEEPTSVVVLSTGQIDGLLTLGVVPTGSTTAEGAELVPNYLLDAYPEKSQQIEAIDNVGTRAQPDLEALLTLSPDLILMNSTVSEDTALYDQLKAISNVVVTEGTGINWKQDFLLLADALGRTDQAQEWLDEYHSDALALAPAAESAPEVSFLRSNGDRTRIFGLASFPGSVAYDARFPRPEDQRFEKTSQDLSEEEFGLADGDIIFYGVQGGNAAELTDAATWPTLQAVQNNSAFQVDDDPFYLNAGPSAARIVLDALAEHSAH